MAYDVRNRMVESAHLDGAATPFSHRIYTLSASGQRLRVEELDGRTVDYAYDALGRLVQESVQDPLNGPRLTSYAYDAVSNRVSRTVDGLVTSYQYDANDRLSEVLDSSGPDASFAYDHDGIRQSRSANGFYTRFLTDPNRPFAQVWKSWTPPATPRFCIPMAWT